MAHPDTFGARSTLKVGDREYEIFRIDALQQLYDVARLPYSLKLLLENLLRFEDGETVTRAMIASVASWSAKGEPSTEIAYRPARRSRSQRTRSRSARAAFGASAACPTARRSRNR